MNGDLGRRTGSAPPAPGAILAQLQRAAALLGQGAYGAAERLCGRMLDVPGARADALHLIGLIELQTARVASGIGHLRQVVAMNPRHSFALCNLGKALLDSGELREALECFERALSVAPGLAQAWYNRGNALKDLGRPVEALASYDSALRAQSDLAAAHNNRGSVLRTLNRWAEALASFDRAVHLDPGNVSAHVNRGNALLELGRPSEALQSYESALRLNPTDVVALYNRGNALRRLQRPEDALASYERALAVDPGHGATLRSRAALLLELRRPEEALVSVDEVLRASPDDVEALDYRGNVLRALRRIDESLASFDRALHIAPRFAPALNNRGTVLGDCERFDEAIASYEAALQITPDRADVLTNLAGAHIAVANARHEPSRFAAAVALLRRALQLDPDRDDALGLLNHAQRCCGDWADLERNTAALESRALSGRPVSTPFAALSIFDTPEAQLQCARAFTAERYPPARQPAWRGTRYLHDRIRVAYVSADLRDHAVSRLLVGVLESHDGTQFETFGISLRPEDPGELGQRVKRAFEHFIDVSRETDDGVARRLADLEVDIAVDLNGHTAGGRTGIFARRAAPLQVGYLGYAGTMGAPYMDYLIADAVVIPPGAEAAYDECIARLPHCYLPTDRRYEIDASTPSRAAAGLPEHGAVLCGFTNGYKINPQLFDVWCRLLHSLPGSVLWLRDAGPEMRDNLTREAGLRGVAAEQLVFAGSLPRTGQHLARLRLADVFLDTTPYNAHSTVCDALWAGVPVVTCIGRTFAGRVAASALRAMGLPELIAGDLEQYECRVRQLLCAPSELAALKRRIAALRMQTPLFDTGRYCRHLERAYLSMQRRFASGARAASFDASAFS